MNPKENLKMLPLAPDDLALLSDLFSIRSTMAARLLYLLKQIKSLLNDKEDLTAQEREALTSLERDLELQIASLLYPALVEAGLMLVPNDGYVRVYC